MSLDRVARERLVRALAGAVIEHADELTRLDQAIGDGDHGLNMKRGFEAVLSTLPGLADKSLPEMLKAIGMTLVMKVGGASGPLAQRPHASTDEVARRLDRRAVRIADLGARVREAQRIRQPRSALAVRDLSEPVNAARFQYRNRAEKLRPPARKRGRVLEDVSDFFDGSAVERPVRQEIVVCGGHIALHVLGSGRDSSRPETVVHSVSASRGGALSGCSEAAKAAEDSGGK